VKFKENLEGIEIIKKSADSFIFDESALNVLSMLDTTA